jgi:hypothetical protein
MMTSLSHRVRILSTDSLYPEDYRPVIFVRSYIIAMCDLTDVILTMANTMQALSLVSMI